MERTAARTVDDFILDFRGQRERAAGDPVRAGLLNTELIVVETQVDPRYRAEQNRGTPKKINSHLVTFDCITCDKCIPVCPNDANFSYHTGVVRLTYRDVEVHPDGSITPVGEDLHFSLDMADQIANFADYCNQCGNCDTFCPEYDGPYLKKPNFFGSRHAFEAAAPHDGFVLEKAPGGISLVCRIEGRMYRLQQSANGGYRYDDGVIVLHIADEGATALATPSPCPAATHRVDMGRFHAIAALLRGITDPTRVHAVNTPLIASEHV